MPTDAQILAAGTAATPLDYEVPNAQELIPLSVNANFDGSGAGGDYLPCVVFISDAGVVIARSALGDTVAAGDDAEVSWFPGVKPAAAAANGASGVPVGRVRSAVPVGLLGPGGTNIVWTLLQTDAPTIYSRDPAHTTFLMLAESGFYAFFCFLTTTASPASLTGTLIVSVSVLDSANASVDMTLARAIDIRDATAADPKEVENAQGWALANCLPASPAPYHAILTLTCSVAINISAVSMVAVRLNPTVLT